MLIYIIDQKLINNMEKAEFKDHLIKLNKNYSIKINNCRITQNATKNHAAVLDL